MDDERRRTLLLLVELSRTSDPVSCWDQERAERLLRNQSSRDELRDAGVDEQTIERLFPENE
jgi:hypothetical protein